MCWSAEVSLNTFLVSAFAVVLAYSNGYPWQVLLFILAFSSMQLVEFAVWRWGLQDPTSRANTLASAAGALLLLAQPIATINLLADSAVRRAFWALYALFLAVNAAAHFAGRQSAGSIFRTTVAENGHLRWHYVSTLSLAITLYMVLILVPVFLASKPAFAVLAAALVASAWTYARHGTWGSMWCWWANAISLLLLAKIVLWDPVRPQQARCLALEVERRAA